MKKKLLSLFVTTVLSSAVSAQTILNGDFENWTTVSKESLDGSGMLQFGTKESKDKTEGNYSVKLENNIKNSKVDAGVVVFGRAGNGLSGGVSYSGAPDSLVGYAKYDIKNGDAAIVWVKVWAGGSSNGVDNMFYLTGNSNSNFVRLAFKLDLGSGAVDSIGIGLTSGNFAATPLVGSWIIWDDVKFVGANVSQIANTNFENWSVVNQYENPDNWNTRNSEAYQNNESSPVVKTTDAHSGTYAIKTTANIKNSGGSNFDMGDIANFVYNVNGGGFNFTGTVDTLVFWYKMSGTGTGSVTVNLKDANNNFQGHADAPLPATNTYTQFKLPFVGQSPTKIEISFAATINPINMNQNGNILFVDEMALMSDLTVGVNEVYNNSKVSVYPNPFQNDIFVNYTSQSTQNISLKIYSVEGKLVQSKSFVASNGLNKFNISVNDLSSGIYHYSLISENSTIASGKLVK